MTTELDNRSSSRLCFMTPRFRKERRDQPFSETEGQQKRRGSDSGSKQDCDDDDDDRSRRSILRRISDRSLGRMSSFGSLAGSRSKHDFDLDGRQDEDPVIALLEARSKQRVRFCLEGNIHASKRVGEPTRRPSDSMKIDSMVVKTQKAPAEEIDDDATVGSFNIKSFMGRIIFNRSLSRSSYFDLEDELEKSSIVWESNEFEQESPEIIHTTKSLRQNSIQVSFVESPFVRANVVKLLEKARKAQFSHYRYRYAMECYMKAYEQLSEARYPNDHPLSVKTLRLLNNSHHALNCFDNSAKIVKMGIKYEEQNDLVRALKMYTIAYRIRRDQISRTHPSLVVLLNILGSIQLKRGELKEAMQIYEVALRDAPAVVSVDDDQHELTPTPSSNLLARAVTFREMGIIHEKWDNMEKALCMYHRSLDCISEWREKTGAKYRNKGPHRSHKPVSVSTSPYKITNVRLRKSYPSHKQDPANVNCTENGEMEALIGDDHIIGRSGDFGTTTDFYNSFFPDVKEATSKKPAKKISSPESKDEYADVEISLTFHQIAQMHRKQGEYGKALDAYRASLRGMKYALGEVHPNVAAILGNIGNLQKEMGDLNSAYDTYQDVLGIEVYRLGVSHPEVAISLHNVATIESARGNFEHALSIYQKVLHLQRKLFGDDNLAVAITSSCLGEVYERLGDIALAIDCYEEALRAKTAVLGRHHLQVARILHKLGKMVFTQKKYKLADSYTVRAVLIYQMNKLADDHAWLIDAERDRADIDAALAFEERFYEV